MPPKRCKSCRRIAKERRENQRWEKKKAEEKILFHECLKSWNVIPLDEMKFENDQILYILGNGFDLMHRVNSSYYAFRDTLGKHSDLRQALENYWTPEDIWADFENALAHFDVEAMSNETVVDDWMEAFDAYDEDASAASYFLATEASANPMLTVVEELPRRFRRWVESLKIGTADRPLQNIFRDGKVLCFNYTEFVETMYHVSEANICYIHGCRRKKKGYPKEKLILGHMPGESEESYEVPENTFQFQKDPYKQAMIELAQEQVIRLIDESDQSLTKNCDEIIASHRPFFDDLNNIEKIVVAGHSLSPVDWDYFAEVVSSLSNPNKVQWYFGCHGLRDLGNLEALLNKIKVEKSSVTVFCTDGITVAPIS